MTSPLAYLALPQEPAPVPGFPQVDVFDGWSCLGPIVMGAGVAIVVAVLLVAVVDYWKDRRRR